MKYGRRLEPANTIFKFLLLDWLSSLGTLRTQQSIFFISYALHAVHHIYFMCSKERSIYLNENMFKIAFKRILLGILVSENLKLQNVLILRT